MLLSLSRCLRELRLQGVDLAPEEFCDAVWLAARDFIAGEARSLPTAKQPTDQPSQPLTGGPRLRTSRLRTSEPLDQPKSSGPIHALGDSGGGKMRGNLLSLPAAPAITHGIEFDRALKPLRQRRQVARTMELDEEATVAAVAETGIWQVVMRPARSRWLDITLVVERSSTMRLWQETSLEFCQLLWRACAPRSLRTYYLEWSPKRLVMRTSGGRPVPVRALRHGQGSRLILVLSDAMSFGWLTADIPELLAQWASSQTTTLVQMLPLSMWQRSALRHATWAAPYQPRRPMFMRGSRENWPLVTVTTLEPDCLRRYVRMLNGSEVDSVAAYRGSRSQFEVMNRLVIEERAPFNPRDLDAGEIEKIFRRFERFSSPETLKLAQHLASAPLVLPVMRVVQRVLVPDAAPSQLAELFLSGILFRRQPDASINVPANQVEYEFLPGLRERLLDLGGLDCSFETIGLLSRYFEQRLGKGGAFTALLEDPTAAAKNWNIASSDSRNQPFARVASLLLGHMGYGQSREEPPEGRPEVVRGPHGDQSDHLPLRVVEATGALPIRAPLRQTAKLFLSYARDDDELFVRRLYQDLTARGFDVWFDRVSMPTRQLSFTQEIRDVIAARDRLVLVVGPMAAVRPHVLKEWGEALFMDKLVNVIVRLDGQGADGTRIDGYALIPEELAFIHAEDFRRDADYAEHLENLVRQLSEPSPPLGKLVGVPALPTQYHAQPDRLRRLRDALLIDLSGPVVVTGPATSTGVQGMGGIGKSVLVNALARDLQVRRAFPDGVFWIPIGQQPNIVEVQRLFAHALADAGSFESVTQGRARLGALLASKAVLVVLDDVWERAHAEAFSVLGPRCRSVITTRDAGLLTSIGATQFHLDLTTEDEALALLASATGVTPDALPSEARQVVHECARLPLALALCAGMFKSGVSWVRLVQRLRQTQFESHTDRSLSDEPGRMAYLWTAVKCSLDALPPEEHRRFIEISVFPKGEAIRETLVHTLWSHTSGLDEPACTNLLSTFANRALLWFDIDQAGQRHLSLHDLIWDFARRLLFGDWVNLVAKAIHQQYLQGRLQSERQMGRHLVPWEKLDEPFKKSNRDVAVDVERKLSRIGCCFLPMTPADSSAIQFTNEETEVLAQMEHERWVEERARTGWKYGPVRDDRSKTSPYLVAWDQVPEGTRERDRFAVRNVPSILAAAGFAIVRLEEHGPLGSTDTDRQTSRPVRIFISSTLRDMHAERDYLRERVFPELDERLRGRLHHLEPIDLRLGVEAGETTAPAAQELLTLKVSLDEISQSSFVIGLVGDLYGWVPPADRMLEAAQEAGYERDLTGRSVMALEIEFAVLGPGSQRQRSRFYLRERLPYEEMPHEIAAVFSETHSSEPGAAGRAASLQELKTLLKTELPADRVRSYAARWDSTTQRVVGLEKWGRQVIDDLWDDLEVETRAFARGYKKHLVFISHDSKPSHRALVAEICDVCRRLGIDFWEHEESNRAGENWKSKEEAIATMTHFIVLLSDTYEQSPTCEAELERAISRGNEVKILPFLLEARQRQNVLLRNRTDVPLHHRRLGSDKSDAENARAVVEDILTYIRK